MDFISVFFIAVGLAMDAFSVSITQGLTSKLNVKHALTIAIFFGGFQALMPVLGWISGIQLENIISTFAPYIAFGLLLIIGVKMIYESIYSSNEDDEGKSLSFRYLLILSIATSIDAFAVGVTFAFLNTPVIQPALIIGIVTFALSFIGVYIGKKIGHFLEGKIEVLGGLILIGIGFKILLENAF